MTKTKQTNDVIAKPGGLSLRVLIVEDDTLVGLGLKSQLQAIGHTVVGHAGDSAQAADLYRAEKPDLVLVDIRLGKDDGIELADELLMIRPCPLIIVSAYSDKELIERAGEAGFYGYLIKPVSQQALAAQIEVAVKRFNEAEQLRADKAKLATDLENRKLMDRAKGILMKRTGLGEDDAHRRLQQESQRRRIPLPELCRRIIESDEVMGL